MASPLKKTFGHAGIYSIGVLLNKAVSFIMLPIYTRCLTPSDYGVLELLEITVEVISLIAGAGMITGISKFYYQYKEQRDRNELVSTLFISVIFLYAVACALGGIFSGPLSNLVFKSGEYAHFIKISFTNLFLSFLIVVPLAYVQTKQRSVFFVIIGTIKLVLQLSFNILFVVYMNMGVAGVLYSTMIAGIIIGSYLTFHTFSEISFRFSKEKAFQLFKFGYPFIFSGLGLYILTFSDRYFLNYFGTVSKVGIYSLGYKFGFLLMAFPITPLNRIWRVQRFEMVNEQGYEKVFNKYLSWFVIMTVSVALIISLVIEDVLKIMSAPSFWGAYRIVPIILLAYIFQACTDYFNFGIFHSGKTKHMAYANSLAAVSIILLSIFLIPRFGIYGAAWATVLSFFMRLGYVYCSSQYLFRINFALVRPIGTLLLSINIFLLYRYSVGNAQILKNFYFSIPLGIAFAVSFWLCLMALKIITREDRNYIFKPFRVISQNN